MDDDFYEDPPINFGQGTIHDLSTSKRKRVKKQPIGFVHFKDHPKRAKKVRRSKRRK